MSTVSAFGKFRKLLNHNQKKKVLIIVVITFIGALFEAMGVSLMVPLVSAIVNPQIITTNKAIASVCAILGIHSHKTFVIVCIIALIALFVFKNIYLIFEYYVQSRFVYNNRFYTQQQLLHSIINKPYEFFLGSSTTEIMRVLDADVLHTFELLMTMLQFVSETMVSLALIVTMLVIDPVMTSIISVLLFAVVAVMTRIVKPYMEKRGQEFRDYYSQTYKWVLQSVQGIKAIKVSQREKYFEDNFSESGRKASRALKWESVFNSIPRALIEMCCVCSTLLVIALMIYFGKPMETLIPALGAFAMAAVKLMPSANRIVNMANSIAFNEPALDNLIRNIQIVEGPEDSDASGKLTIRNKIEVKDITYRYPESKSYVLKKASMEIPIGKSVGIVGKSGSGKTTMVDIIMGLLAPSSGSVCVDGKDIHQNYKEWLTHIGYIPQSIFLLDDDIRSNVAFGCKAEDEQVWQALEDAQMKEFVQSLPDGLDTKIGEQGIRLSGGQRQRIGIARSLYMNPEILVFDEATSSLDNETEKAIMQSINSLHGKKTLIIIAHRLQTIENCDIVYCVKDGNVVQTK